MRTADIFTRDGETVTIPIFRKDDSEFELDHEGHAAYFKKYYSYCFGVLSILAELLDISVPEICIWNSYSPLFNEKLQVFGEGEEEGAYMHKESLAFYKSKSGHIGNCIIFGDELLSYKEKWLGVMAHEMRHIFQHDRKMNMKGLKKGIYSSVNNSLEIEADAYGIGFLTAVTGKSIDKCTEIVCGSSKDIIPADKMAERKKKAFEFADKIKSCCPGIKRKIGKQPTRIGNYVHYIKRSFGRCETDRSCKE